MDFCLHACFLSVTLSQFNLRLFVKGICFQNVAESSLCRKSKTSFLLVKRYMTPENVTGEGARCTKENGEHVGIRHS